MKLSTAVITLIFLLSFAKSVFPAELQNQFEIGRNYYYSAEFKKAISHFERAIAVHPTDARAYFWLGKSYENLVLINGPMLGMNAGSKAHNDLDRAVQLAPEDREYRQELFEFLVNADYSRNALREADSILQTVSESDPDYPFMQLRLHEAHTARSSLEHRAGAVIATPLESLHMAGQPFSMKHSTGM